MRITAEQAVTAIGISKTDEAGIVILTALIATTVTATPAEIMDKGIEVVLITTGTVMDKAHLILDKAIMTVTDRRITGGTTGHRIMAADVIGITEMIGTTVTGGTKPEMK